MNQRETTVTVLSVKSGSEHASDPHYLGTVSGDDLRYWVLPGATKAEVEKALRGAGFEPRDRFLDTMNQTEKT